MSDVAKKVETLMEAMPYLEKYQGKVIVIKYGGNAMINDELKDAVLHDVVMLKLLGLKPVLSHGGGPGINKMLEKLNIPVQFINGLRYTSEDIMRVVEMVLVGQVNTELVGRINQIGGKAVGLSGVSGDIYHCHKRSEELGFVGDIDYVNADAINAMLDAGFIPVIAPVGTDGQGNTYNINGDTAAGKLASALGAEKLVILTDIEGLCNDIKVRDVISYLNIQDVKALQRQGHHRRRHDPPRSTAASRPSRRASPASTSSTAASPTPYSTRPSPPKAPAPRSAPHSRALASSGKKYIKF